MAGLGYEWMELSPKADFILFFRYPGSTTPGSGSSRRSRVTLGWHRVGVAGAALVGTGRGSTAGGCTGLEAGHPDHRGSGRGDLNPSSAAGQSTRDSRGPFLKSMDELLPIFEREGLQLIIEPHPDDFIEDGLEALN